ncbi:MAG: hypothetical protein PHE88_12025 [Elusimicrobia bacterium]|nr:hypothetical protein [Elusimicrobiota bacterium]
MGTQSKKTGLQSDAFAKPALEVLRNTEKVNKVKTSLPYDAITSLPQSPGLGKEKEVKQSGGGDSKNKIMKTTCYLSKDSFIALDKLSLDLKVKYDKKVPRSFLIDRAIELLEKDLNINKESSILLKK